MVTEPLRVFVGYDGREKRAFDVCVRSMRALCTKPLQIERLHLPSLRRAGLYRRRHEVVASQRIDCGDDRPISTEFAFSRFLVPALCQWRGVALFCDSDFLWRRDVSKLFDAVDTNKSVQVVKHAFEPSEGTKMRGQVQQPYPRKCWSSLMLFNFAQPFNLWLTPEEVNQRTGRWLHNFGWLPDDQIGELNPGWNWLEGDGEPDDPAAVHYTHGTPDMPGHSNAAFAEEWRAW